MSAVYVFVVIHFCVISKDFLFSLFGFGFSMMKLSLFCATTGVNFSAGATLDGREEVCNFVVTFVSCQIVFFFGFGFIMVKFTRYGSHKENFSLLD